MDKRYQVFISSTFEDLQDERKEVMNALLELNCIPAGMELFPASSEEQWSLIKRVIKDSDYYILILGGRYGSCDNDGMGYTEKEYRYAMDIGKPVIAFLHKSPSDIPVNKSEHTQEGRKKLKKFRELAQTQMIKYWTNPSELGGVVSRSVIRLIEQFPQKGWVKNEGVVDELEVDKKIHFLIDENGKLHLENEYYKNIFSSIDCDSPFTSFHEIKRNILETYKLVWAEARQIMPDKDIYEIILEDQSIYQLTTRREIIRVLKYCDAIAEGKRLSLEEFCFAQTKYSEILGLFHNDIMNSRDIHFEFRLANIED